MNANQILDAFECLKRLKIVKRESMIRIARAAWKRRKRATDPEYRANENSRSKARRRRKRANDLEYRKKDNAKKAARRRRKYAIDPNYLAKALLRRAARRIGEP